MLRNSIFRLIRNTSKSISNRYASSLTFNEYGPPYETVGIHNFPDPEPKESNEVVVKMLMSPINPADINMIQGVYPIDCTLPAIGGGEGVGIVISKSNNVTSLQEGDYVLPITNMAGTWATHIVKKDYELIKIPNDIPPELSCQLRVNPGTAYRMLVDFVALNEGDVVIQNGANSSCGQYLIQIAKIMGFRTINVIRDRDDFEVVASRLKLYGADYVLTESELMRQKIFNEIPKPKLAINAIGGSYSNIIAKVLDNNAFHVTYGGMSYKPVTAVTSSLIFKDITYKGFWFSRWMENASLEDQQNLFNKLINWASSGKLVSPPIETYKIEDHREALINSNKGFKQSKKIFDFR